MTLTGEGKKLDKRIKKYLELAQKAGNSTDYMELDIEEIEARLAASTGPWDLKQEDEEGVYMALATGSAKWSIVAIRGECDGDLTLIKSAYTDIASLIALAKQQRIMIAMLSDNLDSLQGGIVRFLEGGEQGVKDGTVIYTDEPK